jgi:hypothetical protein
MAPKRQPPGRRSSTTTCRHSPRPGNRQPRRNCAESNWFGWPETSAAVRPMLPGRSSSNGSGGRPDGRSKRAAATAPASADSSGGHTEPSGCPTIWPTSCPRYASNVGNAGAAGRGPTAYEAICLTSGMSSASTGIICSVRSVCALHTTHCRPNVTFRIGLSGNNLWKQSKQIF